MRNGNGTVAIARISSTELRVFRIRGGRVIGESPLALMIHPALPSRPERVHRARQCEARHYHSVLPGWADRHLASRCSRCWPIHIVHVRTKARRRRSPRSSRARSNGHLRLSSSLSYSMQQIRAPRLHLGSACPVAGVPAIAKSCPHEPRPVCVLTRAGTPRAVITGDEFGPRRESPTSRQAHRRFIDPEALSRAARAKMRSDY